MGTTPELEMAMYTLCFRSRQFSSRVCDIKPDDLDTSIQTHKYDGVIPSVVATSYVIC